ncbi:MAG: dipeptidase [Thermoanaerobaculia bacterium]|nr:dipeptidase [Thermoanaerobaculia bacterium]
MTPAMTRESNLFRLLALALLMAPAAVLGACSGPETVDAPDTSTTEASAQEEDARSRAEHLASEYLILDGHIDVPYRLEASPADVSRAIESGDFDYPRAKRGGLDVPFMSIYIPADYQQDAEGGAKELADKLIDGMDQLSTDHPDKFAKVTSTEEAYAAFAQGKVGIAMGMENGAPVEGDLANLQHFYDRGIRYITLTHSKNNHISDSSYEDADNRKWDGLSSFGEELVANMNDLGIMVDISHVSDAAFWDVMEITKAPAIASHSSCRRFTPGFERNMTDEMIIKLAENGGVIQINFGSSFLTSDAQQHSTNRWAAVRAYAEEHGLERGDEELTAFVERHREENPFPFADLDDVVAHIDHVVRLVGIDHVGLGSDFDGVGDSLPTGLKSVADYPNLIRALLVKGYSDEDIEKILSGNVMRVWREVERVASEA